MVKDTSAAVLTAPDLDRGGEGNNRATRVGEFSRGSLAGWKALQSTTNIRARTTIIRLVSPLSRHRRQMEWQSRSPCCTRPLPQTPNRYISVYTALAPGEPTTPTLIDSSSNRIYLFSPMTSHFEPRYLLSGRGPNVNLFILVQLDNAQKTYIVVTFHDKMAVLSESIFYWTYVRTHVDIVQFHGTLHTAYTPVCAQNVVSRNRWRLQSALVPHMNNIIK